MDYAVTLEFDRETENKIQEMIDEVAKVTGCDYMKQSKIPPHVTVSALVSDNEEALLAEMESIAEKSGVSVEEVKKHYADPRSKEYLIDDTKEQKLYKELFAQVKVTKGDKMVFADLFKR